MTDMTIVEAIRSALFIEMERDERVMVLGMDVGQLGGVFRATQGLLDRFGPSRVVDMPLAEAVIVGSSLGLAVGGMVPVAEIQFLQFAHQAFHQLGRQLGRYRFRSGGRYHAQVTVRAPCGGYVRNPEFHSDSIEAELVHQPGLKVVCPSTAYDAKGMLLEAIRDPDPVIFVEPMRLYRLGRDSVPDGDYTVPFGKVRMARPGDDLVLIAWSAAVELCLRAADALAAEGIDAAVLDLRSLSPLDVSGLVDAVTPSGKAIVVQEAPLTAGFGAEISATLQGRLSTSSTRPSCASPRGIPRIPPEPWRRGTCHRWRVSSKQPADLRAPDLTVLLGPQQFVALREHPRARRRVHIGEDVIRSVGRK
jgi:pyruvate dehydrogenase E1 component beta subunit